ncbi:hypothetical protein PACTADRAFT_1128 [Pachysolen tannophilus NRRL Y-2460]|uniref:Enoyl reductase (ER) domain-containing protein n=1 Tax=Pachysolen tannophilus NRRL Y-2460 TaxID=669874 RepID=A0A1E4TXQ7_PACTA|nr:hypothetical protein PACTADRAFT_1128 [Pachysolen tannophilus NRRL Y-2460]
MSIPTSIDRIVIKNRISRNDSDVIIHFGQKDSTFEFVTVPFNPNFLKHGEILIKPIYFSNDPMQKSWLVNWSPDELKRSPLPALPLGQPLISDGIAEVILSKSSKFAVGDKVSGLMNWSTYCVVSESSRINKINESFGLPLTLYLSALGLTGLTAYFGIKETCKVKETDIVVISGASGATGSIAVQIAKKMCKAKKVIGIAGTKEKCEWVKSLGADACIDYCDPNFENNFSKELGDDEVDIFYDLVGGKILNFLFTKVKKHGKIVSAGAITLLSNIDEMKLTNWINVIVKDFTIQGFLLSDHMANVSTALMDIIGSIKSNLIKTDDIVHVYDLSKDKNDFKKIPETWNQFLSHSSPKGKTVIKVA